MDHLPFITGSYALAVVVMAAIVGWLVADARSVARRLAELEARGVRRRSASARVARAQ